MALIKLGAFVTEVSGKIGGTVFSKNKGGAYAKNRVVPSNPQTTFQANVRAFFAQIAKKWKTLTQAQRDSWSAAALTVTKINRLGDTIKLSGSQLYQERSLNLYNARLQFIDSPVVGVINLNNFLSIFSKSVAALSVNTALQPVGVTMVWYATPSVSPGIKNIGNLYRRIGKTTSLDLSPVDLTTFYNDKFGPAVVGQRVGIRCVVIENASGLSSLKNELDFITVA